jgi:hypothetical protein
MSTYREVELRCDGVPNDPFGCNASVFAHTAFAARRDAREEGWRVGLKGGRDFCPKHKDTEWRPTP